MTLAVAFWVIVLIGACLWFYAYWGQPWRQAAPLFPLILLVLLLGWQVFGAAVHK